MSTPLQKQKRLQIVLAIIIGMTIPCYSLGFIFLSFNSRTQPAVTPGLTDSPTVTWAPRNSATPAPVIPTRFPTFTPTLTGTATLTPTASFTPSLTPTPTHTPTETFTPTFTVTPAPSHTPTLPTTEPPSG
jgi:hypothetical protein